MSVYIAPPVKKTDTHTHPQTITLFHCFPNASFTGLLQHSVVRLEHRSFPDALLLRELSMNMGLTVLQIYDVSNYPLHEIAQRLRDKQELLEVYLTGLDDQHLTAAIEIATIVNASQPRQHTRPKEFVVFRQLGCTNAHNTHRDIEHA